MKIMDEKKQVKEIRMLLSFYSKETDKNYLIYTDDTYDESNSLIIYASIYDEDELKPIKSDKEWNIIELLITKYYEKEC